MPRAAYALTTKQPRARGPPLRSSLPLLLLCAALLHRIAANADSSDASVQAIHRDESDDLHVPDSVSPRRVAPIDPAALAPLGPCSAQGRRITSRSRSPECKEGDFGTSLNLGVTGGEEEREWRLEDGGERGGRAGEGFCGPNGEQISDRRWLAKMQNAGVPPWVAWVRSGVAYGLGFVTGCGALLWALRRAGGGGRRRRGRRRGVAGKRRQREELSSPGRWPALVCKRRHREGGANGEKRAQGPAPLDRGIAAGDYDSWELIDDAGRASSGQGCRLQPSRKHLKDGQERDWAPVGGADESGAEIGGWCTESGKGGLFCEETGPSCGAQSNDGFEGRHPVWAVPGAPNGSYPAFLSNSEASVPPFGSAKLIFPANEARSNAARCFAFQAGPEAQGGRQAGRRRAGGRRVASPALMGPSGGRAAARESVAAGSAAFSSVLEAPGLELSGGLWSSESGGSGGRALRPSEASQGSSVSLQELQAMQETIDRLTEVMETMVRPLTALAWCGNQLALHTQWIVPQVQSMASVAAWFAAKENEKEEWLGLVDYLAWGTMVMNLALLVCAVCFGRWHDVLDCSVHWRWYQMGNSARQVLWCYIKEPGLFVLGGWGLFKGWRALSRCLLSRSRPLAMPLLFTSLALCGAVVSALVSFLGGSWTVAAVLWGVYCTLSTAGLRRARAQMHRSKAASSHSTSPAGGPRGRTGVLGSLLDGVLFPLTMSFLLPLVMGILPFWDKGVLDALQGWLGARRWEYW
ncbi:unnamed protein product [Ostreobium quekettii]|uniref:Transmembrane protein n=1 Tax=Ostreobium quekettii TaxID=121088 RepID=A0A8S1J3D1_9CHLO|nr:unnamed protein product [Ostreobium quekettii]